MDSHLPPRQHLLEKDFVLVQWDQRGAGRTFLHRALFVEGNGLAE